MPPSTALSASSRRMPPLAESVSPEKILVRGVNWLGDAVMTIPAVERLREAKPHAEIVIATPEKIAALWQNSPLVNSVISLPRASSVFAVGREIRRHRFDQSVIFPNSPRAALESFLGRVHDRIGYRSRWRRWLLTKPVEPEPGFIRMRKKSLAEIKRLVAGDSHLVVIPAQAHQMHHYLRLVAMLGASAEPLRPRIWIAETEVASFIEKFGLRSDSRNANRWFGMNPGAEYGPAKRWPWERFATTALRIHQKTGGRWLIFGGKGDVELAGQIEQGIRRGSSAETAVALNLAGRTSLRELCVGLKVCSAVLTNDTGPMHLAAAVGTNVVALFGSTAPGLTGPGLPGDNKHILLQADVPCAPCFLPECPIDFRCMKSLDEEAVVAAMLGTALEC